VLAKVEVNGAGADPLFTYLTSAAKGIAGTVDVKWNFTKFLLDADGHALTRYAPTTSPSAIAPDLEPLLDPAS